MPRSTSRTSRTSDPRIALVTYAPRQGTSLDRDLPSLRDAVAATGAETFVVHWDDPAVDWASHDLVVIRSTWDYTWRTEEFLPWVDRCGAVTRLANPPGVVRWNSDKRYLGELSTRGVPAVATRYLPPGTEPDGLPGDHEYVVKPAAGAGARYAGRYRADGHDVARAHIARMHAEGLTAMVQPYMPAIDTSGERALVFIGGRFLHAVAKNAVLSHATAYDERKVAHPGVRPWTPTAAELATAEAALAVVPGGSELLYARVDLVDDEDGAPCVMELELIEPNLFLDLHPASLPVVADAIASAARG
ncbi:RimK family alpha-L-glutamate ligase [Streptomyces sp. NPDC058691]|uniref:ATP-grasp domain-containing protein n=1 Tax=Streptomyces sp. NPDC058691 TaxID=3346601 RepID=UPI003669C1AB